jgi:hypothetical protein
MGQDYNVIFQTQEVVKPFFNFLQITKLDFVKSADARRSYSIQNSRQQNLNL